MHMVLLLAEEVDVRKLLLVYRLRRWNDTIPDVKGLKLKRRNSQLCKPLIRLFQYASKKTREEIMESLTRLLKEKNERKKDTIEAKLHGIVSGLAKNAKQVSLDADEAALTSAGIWAAIIGPGGIEGAPVPGKPQTWDTE